MVAVTWATIAMAITLTVTGALSAVFLLLKSERVEVVDFVLATFVFEGIIRRQRVVVLHLPLQKAHLALLLER